MLAQKMEGRVRMLSQFIRPDGQRARFTKQLQDADALNWWRIHRYDDLGSQVLAGMRPNDIAELDQALNTHVEQQQAML